MDKDGYRGDYFERQEFDRIVHQLKGELPGRPQPPEDGYDRHPRPNPFEGSSRDGLPLGHIAFMGDFEPGHDEPKPDSGS
jgi:hypothetical protein